MHRPRRFSLIFATAIPILLILSAQGAFSGFEREPGFSYPAVREPYIPKPFKPNQYVAFRTAGPIVIDGALGESSWTNAPWTNRFGHIFMTGYKKPFLATRAKMLWDDANFYAAVEIEEPNLMGHVFTKDEEIYFDNDIELFIDVDGDSQNYIELEFNCLGTPWDMLLPKEYNRGGIPFSHPRMENSPPWDLEGMRAAVWLNGSLNYPLDTDGGWIIEIALPWESLRKTALNGDRPDRDGGTMRLNFSRVELEWNRVWPIVDWTGRSKALYDWTWSPNLVYNMHSVESWGRVVMSGRTVLEPEDPAIERAFPFTLPPAPKRPPKPGSMVRIKGGSYPIGPDPTDPKDSPAGRVSVKDFFIDCYEVTIGEYVRFLNAGGHDAFYGIDMENPDFCGIVKAADGKYSPVPGKEMYPVTLVTAEGAGSYAAWAGKRLPTEYEWEIAARGAEGRRYPWGGGAPDSGRADFDYMVGHPAPVGSYENGKTPEGVYDLCGNVWEMCSDTWRRYPWSVVTVESPARGRIIRGGSWATPTANLAAAYRNGNKGEWSATVGFRCAKDGK